MELRDWAFVTLVHPGVIVSANRAASALLGERRPRLIGQPLARFVAPEDAAEINFHWRAALADEGPQQCVVGLRRRAGVRVRLESIGSRRFGDCWTRCRTLISRAPRAHCRRASDRVAQAA